jgi:hypothetical protein
MTKVSKLPRHKEAPAPATRAAARVAPRHEIADRRLRISARLTNGLSIAYIARVEPLTFRRRRQVIAEMRRKRQRAAREMAPKGLKRLIPGSEIVVARKPRTYKIWYSRTNRSAATPEVSGTGLRAPKGGRPGSDEGNFPPRKPLKFLETRKESRSRPC